MTGVQTCALPISLRGVDAPASDTQSAESDLNEEGVDLETNTESAVANPNSEAPPP